MTQNQLDLFCIDNFDPHTIDDLIYKVSIVFVEKYFIKNNISNFQYEKDVFKILQQLITKELILIFKDSIEFSTELSAYIFKKKFKLIFQHISKFLLKEVAFSNQNIIEFLKYYSLNTIVIDGKKYKVPRIQVMNEPSWHVTSMLSTTKAYIKANEYIIRTEEKKEKLYTKMNFLHVDGISPIEYNAEIEKKYTILNTKITDNASKINILRDFISLQRDKDKVFSSEIELDILLDERIELRVKKANLTKMKIKQAQLTQYTNIIKEIETILRFQKPYHQILEQNKVSYLSIENSLIKALISKREAIRPLA